jgi:hypothetical protein
MTDPDGMFGMAAGAASDIAVKAPRQRSPNVLTPGPRWGRSESWSPSPPAIGTGKPTCWPKRSTCSPDGGRH